MDFDMLERRTDPRTQAFLPVTLALHDGGEEAPAHLLDLSCGGAGILTTSYNAPAIGQYLDLRFEMPNSDGGTESNSHHETGIVINVRKPERGIARVGIRFIQHRGINSDLFDPNEILSTYRKSVPAAEQGNRWQTVRGFENLGLCTPQVIAN